MVTGKTTDSMITAPPGSTRERTLQCGAGVGKKEVWVEGDEFRAPWAARAMLMSWNFTQGQQRPMDGR